MIEPVDQFRAALARRGIVPKGGEIVADGRIHRADAEGRGGKGDAAYLLHLDGIPAGGFENWRDGFGWENWRADIDRALSPAERGDMARRLAQAKAQREAQQRQQQADNAQRNAALWAKAVPVTEDDPVSLYLRRRGLAGPVPEHLRLHPRLTYWEGGDRGAWPAMIAPLICPRWRGAGSAPHLPDGGRQQGPGAPRQAADRRGRAAGRRLHPAARPAAWRHRHR